MSKVAFEPFQKVLVRDCDDSKWEINLFERMEDGKYLCLAGAYYQCLPYNGETKHLIGTANSPTPPESEFRWGDHVEVRDKEEEDWEQAIYLETIEAKYPYKALCRGSMLMLQRYKYCRHAEW